MRPRDTLGKVAPPGLVDDRLASSSARPSERTDTACALGGGTPQTQRVGAVVERAASDAARLRCTRRGAAAVAARASLWSQGVARLGVQRLVPTEGFHSGCIGFWSMMTRIGGGEALEVALDKARG